MEDTMADIFGSNGPINQQVPMQDNSVTTNTIPLQDIFTPTNNQDVNVDQSNVISMQDLIKEEESKPEKVVVKKKDKILMIQIALIIGWVVSTVLVYYFGYDFFEPFIEV